MNTNNSNPNEKAGPFNELQIAVVYDNHSVDERLKTGWGFSAVITVGAKKILFDFGGEGGILLENMARMGIGPEDIETAAVSHHHADHTGGLEGVLEKNPDITIYLPKGFPAKVKRAIVQRHNRIIEVKNSKKLFDNLYLIIQEGRFVNEQFIVVRTAKGVVLVAGCGHPGIVKMIESTKELLRENILLVMGCFHLEWALKGKVERIIRKFREMDVRYVGPAHGTSDKARELFKKHFGKRYIEAGVGKIIDIAELD